MGFSRWVVASVACASVALMACSSAPGEESASSAEQLIVPPNPPVPIRIPPPVCNYVFPREYPADVCPDLTSVEAWAVQTNDGTCPPIATAHGTWAQIFSVPLPAGYSEPFNGVPGMDNSHWFPPPVPDCSSIESAPCCTYVYWPNGWPTNPDPAIADGSALCTWNTTSITAIPVYKCPITIRGSVCGCASPGGDKCSTCSGWGATGAP